MITITEFLVARIAEDEATAQAFGQATGSLLLEEDASGDLMLTIGADRVLAECAAKRAIVEHWGPYETLEGPDLLRALAAVYADHPDYQPDWAQEG
ncbi:DUF6221 family protein [Arthrobacter sp. zg-Y859]|uniref:DUF6221 family protein n=1 Tax=Arthrobacter jinronghuae TaxID=2964609 RepID=A0ABT1NV53_9MICC|nr:DUF6221 family protein [Arthrobacter jinronghuae]MCQ1951610.1 DUF6221 family protein [Arthrobacter jinronghuae]UWX79676.1 DUF6221 family protein [Arthrobacter jinronghuae]